MDPNSAPKTPGVERDEPYRTSKIVAIRVHTAHCAEAKCALGVAWPRLRMYTRTARVSIFLGSTALRLGLRCDASTFAGSLSNGIPLDALAHYGRVESERDRAKLDRGVVSVCLIALV